MKDTARKFLIAIVLVAAVLALLTARNFHAQEQLADMPDNSAIGTGKPVLLELGAHWCPPCRQMIPVLNELAAEPQGFTVAYVDVDNAPDTAHEYGIDAIPTQIFFDEDGNELFRHVGFYPKASILAKWKELGINTE